MYRRDHAALGHLGPLRRRERRQRRVQHELRRRHVARLRALTCFRVSCTDHLSNQQQEGVLGILTATRATIFLSGCPPSSASAALE